MIEGPAEVLNEAMAGMPLDGCTLEPRDFKRGRTERESYFNLFLLLEGKRSRGPVVQGLFFSGRGDYIKAWIEFRYNPRAEFDGGTVLDLEERGLTAGMFSLLGAMIPPGGSMMAIYGAEAHAVCADTEWGLKRSFPPPATPLGYYLWKSGMRWFKDWYFPEGWMEGGMKLQATRPLNQDICLLREEQAARELAAFLSRLRGRDLEPLERDALVRAEEVLSSLAPPGKRAQDP